MRSGSSSHSRVLPSMSVNKNVVRLDGSCTAIRRPAIVGIMLTQIARRRLHSRQRHHLGYCAPCACGLIIRCNKYIFLRASLCAHSTGDGVKRSLRRGARRWMTASLLLVYTAGCTHMPSGEKAFDSFESCIGGNLGLAAVGGVAAGALGNVLAKQATGSKSAADTAGSATRGAAPGGIGMGAWGKSAGADSTSKNLPPPPR